MIEMTQCGSIDKKKFAFGLSLKCIQAHYNSINYQGKRQSKLELVQVNFKTDLEGLVLKVLSHSL